MFPWQIFHTRPDWEDSGVTSVNRAPAHSPWRACDTIENAKNGLDSKYIISLNGAYGFRLFDDPGQADGFYMPDYEGGDLFAQVSVPGNWELEGFGEPAYTNVVMPWDPKLEEPCNIYPNKGGPSAPNPPHTPKANKTGCYRRYFEVPECFGGRDVFVCFDGVEAAYYLWVNGKPVGYSEDSKLPSEFDITEFIVPGRNLMALMVLRFASSTWLEDQDYWYLSGIYRGVRLVSKPKLCIRDYFVKAVPSLPLSGGEFTADVSVSRVDGFADCSVRMILYDRNGYETTRSDAKVNARAGYRTDASPTANAARIYVSLPFVELWSPDYPNLYRAVFVLLSASGDILDIETCRFGFKKIEITGGILKLNGRRLVVRGVNRHEHCAETGRSVGVEHMRREICEMKRMNVNSVRTCHYPDMPEWYDLCDELGILLICECNLETHAVMGQLSHDPGYAVNYLERAMRMVMFHKNHTSIYSWSLGNESGTGANHAAMYGFIKEFDETRICQYEAGEPGKNVSDIRGNMYAPVGKILEMLADPRDDRPIVLVEYLYQISNAGGGVDKFVSLTETYERFQGGYIWDWQDKSLIVKDGPSGPFYGYGGDFGESMTDYDVPVFMCCNGIVLPDLTWKPVAYGVKIAYAPVGVSRRANGDVYTFRNDSHDRDLNCYRCLATLLEDGVAVESREIEAGSLRPGESKDIRVTFPRERLAGREYHLEFSFTQCFNSFYADSGYEVCFRQFKLTGRAPAKARELLPTAGRLNLSEDGGHITIRGEGFEYRFRKSDGAIVEANKNGAAYFTESGGFIFERPRTGLDAKPGWGIYGDTELTFAENLVCEADGETEAYESADGSSVMLETGMRYLTEDGGCICCKIGRRIGKDGKIRVTISVNANAFDKYLPRAGIEMILPEGFDELSYFGYGEVETYCDRTMGARLGVFRSTVEGLHFPFIPPSECGGREGTRWLAFSDKAGRSIKITGARPFHFDARNYTVKSCLAAAHDHEIERIGETVLHIDAAHGPIGGDMAWSTVMPAEFALKGGCYALEFTVEMA